MSDTNIGNNAAKGKDNERKNNYQYMGRSMKQQKQAIEELWEKSHQSVPIKITRGPKKKTYEMQNIAGQGPGPRVLNKLNRNDEGHQENLSCMFSSLFDSSTILISCQGCEQARNHSATQVPNE